MVFCRQVPSGMIGLAIASAILSRAESCQGIFLAVSQLAAAKPVFVWMGLKEPTEL